MSTPGLDSLCISYSMRNKSYNESFAVYVIIIWTKINYSTFKNYADKPSVVTKIQ